MLLFQEAGYEPPELDHVKARSQMRYIQEQLSIAPSAGHLDFTAIRGEDAIGL